MTGNRYPKISKQSIEDVKAVDILLLAQALGQPMKKRGANYFLNCPNPNHQETTPFQHFSLNPYKNFCKCFNCGVFIKDAIAFYSWVKYGEGPFYQRDKNKEQATQEVREKWHVHPERFFSSIPEIAKLVGLQILDVDGNVLVAGSDVYVARTELPELEPQKPRVVDAVYRAFLSLCPLNQHHADELMQKRQYTPEQINLYMIRSVPSREQWVNIYMQLKQLGYPLERIPGFSQAFVPATYQTPFPREIGEPSVFKDEKGVTHEGHWFYVPSAAPGYFIPIRDENGYIIRLRVCQDNKSPKYAWFSSSHSEGLELNVHRVRRNGVNSGAPYHMAVPTNVLRAWKQGENVTNILKVHTVIVTEGEHKSNISANTFGTLVVGVPGAGAFANLLPLLQKWGVKKLVIAYDMDTLQREDDSIKADKKFKNLYAILQNFASAAKDLDIAAFLWTWNLADGKGLDDLVLNRKLPVEFNLRTNQQRAVTMDSIHVI